ncbi:MAG TPA: TlpA disulfide reductase family protein [Gaiellaceae bacterium]|nr:TlpA disulfide reductase family protein [Gaiellaceae bacterium]
MDARAAVRLWAQAVALACVGALGAVLVWRLTHRPPPPKVGGPAPAFSLSRLDGGGTVSLASLRGKTVVLNFWASWCGPCKREAPQLEKLWRQYRGKGVVVLGVDSGDVAGDARRFLSAHGVTYPVVTDPDQTVSADSYRLPGLPATFVVDRRGRLVGDGVLGPISEKAYADRFHRNLEAALRS